MKRESFKKGFDALCLPAQPALPSSRRAFLIGAASTLLAPQAFARSNEVQVDEHFWKRPRQLWLKRAGTHEEIRTIYWINGEYRPEEYVKLCWILRDLDARQAVQMDVTLLNVLAGAQSYYRSYGLNQPLIVTSGFRTRQTNERLRSEGAAKNSMHLYGKAIDMTLPGIPVEHLGKVIQYLFAGGVGFYPSRRFVHVDTGRPRSWHG